MEDGNPRHQRVVVHTKFISAAQLSSANWNVTSDDFSIICTVVSVSDADGTVHAVIATITEVALR